MKPTTTEWVTQWLLSFGFDTTSAQYIKLMLFLLALFCLCFLMNFIVKKMLIRLIEFLIKKTKNAWDDTLVKHKVFSTLSHMVPAIVIYLTTPYVFDDFPDLIPFILRLTNAYIATVIIIVIINFMNVLQYFFEKTKFFNDNPLQSYFQLAKMTISFLLDKSPFYFFSALGAMTVVLLLIFKDTIMGFVASIQLSVNDMLHIGDWVTMPKYDADGDVIEINLTTIKIQNWDKTITTIPTYAFIADSFKNWRGMTASGGRRIKRSLYIKISSIKFCSPDILDRFKKFHLIQAYVEEKSQKITAFNREHSIDKSNLINGRNLTNIGVFRVYAENYIRNNPDINLNMTCMVRQLKSTEKGLPIEIYTFSKQQDWVTYERIVSDMFDHLIAAVPEFDLEIFQNPTGTDFERL